MKTKKRKASSDTEQTGSKKRPDLEVECSMDFGVDSTIGLAVCIYLVSQIVDNKRNRRLGTHPLYGLAVLLHEPGSQDAMSRHEAIDARSKGIDVHSPADPVCRVDIIDR